MSLFRDRVHEAVLKRLEGDVLVVPRRNHFAAFFLFLVWIASAFLFVYFCHYSKQETLQGWIEPGSGLARLHGRGNGQISELLVKLGDIVAADQPLVRVRRHRTLSSGSSLFALLASEQEKQKETLLAARARQLKIAKQQEATSLLVRQNIVNEIALLKSQEKTMFARHELMLEQVNRVLALKDKGYVTELDLEKARDANLNTLSDFYSIQSQIEAKRGQLLTIDMERQRSVFDSEREIDRIELELSGINQSLAKSEIESEYLIESPFAGVVVDLQAKRGATANENSPLVSIISSDSDLLISLLASSTSVAFLEPGLDVSVRLDAFPYEKFGTVKATLLTVSELAMRPTELANVPFPVNSAVYKVTASIDENAAGNFEAIDALRAGMTLAADVKLERRSILNWALGPIVSLIRRT